MRTLYFCPVVSSSFFFPRLISAVANWMSTVLPHMVWPYSANLGCRSETCYTPLAENTGHKNRQKFAICALSHNIDGFIFATRPKARIDNRKKNLLKSNVSPTCSYNYFGPLAAEIASVVWGTPANFNGFRVLAALLQGTLVVGVSQTLRH